MYIQKIRKNPKKQQKSEKYKKNNIKNAKIQKQQKIEKYKNNIKNAKIQKQQKIEKYKNNIKNAKIQKQQKIEKYKNRLISRAVIPSGPRGLQNVASLLLGSEELGCKIYISPSPLGRCILRIAAASPLYFTPYFKSHSKPSSPPGNCFCLAAGTRLEYVGGFVSLEAPPLF